MSMGIKTIPKPQAICRAETPPPPPLVLKSQDTPLTRICTKVHQMFSKVIIISVSVLCINEKHGMDIVPRATSLCSFFNQSETKALRTFHHLLTLDEQGLVLEIFEKRCLISKEFRCICISKIGNKEKLARILTNHLSKICIQGLPYVIFVIHHFGQEELAYRLYMYMYRCMISDERLPPIVYKVTASNRGRIQTYFETMKEYIQNMNFRDPMAHFTKLSINIRQKIDTGIISGDVTLTDLCDKYIVQLALVIDSKANKTNHIDPNDQLFLDMESIISKTSCPDLSRCMLYGRRAVILSFANKKSEGEELVRQALVCADRVSDCLETVDLLYKIVLFLRAWYQHHPQIMTNVIYDHYKRALQILENEQEDVRLLWTRRFVFRLLCCFLGLGMRCCFIKQFQCPSHVLQEAERLIVKYDSPEAERRIQMFYAIAKSRLCQLKGNITQALVHIDQAKEIATDGNYKSELKTILEAEGILYLPDAPSLRVETEDSACNYSRYPGVSELIKLPLSYHLPNLSYLDRQYVELTNSPVCADETVTYAGEGTEFQYRRDEGARFRNNVTIESPRSHDLSKEAIHIKSAKRT